MALHVKRKTPPQSEGGTLRQGVNILPDIEVYYTGGYVNCVTKSIIREADRGLGTGDGDQPVGIVVHVCAC